MQRIDEHQARHLGRMRARVGPDDEGAERVSDQYDGCTDLCVSDHLMELVDQRRHRPRGVAQVAPGESGAVVAARAREARYFGLDAAPAQGRGGDARIEDHGGRAVPFATVVKTMSSDA